MEERLGTEEDLLDLLRRSDKIRLFLDYDGTLAPFAPTPDDVLPDALVIDLVTRVAQQPNIRVTIVSGRRLGHIRKLLPIPDIILAGTYGVEMQLLEQGEFHRVNYDEVRPILDRLKPRWQALIDGRENFYLEDKGWTLAIHGRYAEDGEAQQVLHLAREMLEEIGPLDNFRVLGGYKFLEIGPSLANKGDAISFLLEQFPSNADAQVIYFGDDDKDEEAFEVINTQGGVSVLVSPAPRRTQAQYRIDSPDATRGVLAFLARGKK